MSPSSRPRRTRPGTQGRQRNPHVLQDIREKAPALAPLVQELLGCMWGRGIAAPDDQTPCDEQAIRIVVLHPGGGERGVAVKLCATHIAKVDTITTPHDEGAT